VAAREPLEGLFGLFDDSLPDSWGRLLMDRVFRDAGVASAGITPLDRLAFLGIFRAQQETRCQTCFR